MITVKVAEDPAAYSEGVRRLLDEADDEFIPNLTSEDRTGVSRSNDEEWFTSIDEYVEAALRRELIVALDGDKVVGMISFEQIADMPTLEASTPTNYVTELIVAKDHRGQGIATSMYKLLINDLPEELQRRSISTKTWSTNDKHISILDTLGFECAKRIPDDRGDGIDTVYYTRMV